MLHLLLLIGATKVKENKLILLYASMAAMAKSFPHHEVFLLLKENEGTPNSRLHVFEIFRC